MSRVMRMTAIASLGLCAGAIALSQPREPLLAAPVPPQQYGTQDATVTVISAAQVYPYFEDYDYPSLSGYCRYGCPDGFHFYQQVEVPAGAVIDYIGVNTATTGDAVMGFTLHFRDHLGGTAQLVSASLPGHDTFSTDFFGPLGIQVPNNLDRVFILDLEQAPLPSGSDQQFFGYFEVWWHRTVSDPPATPTFGDVPASHPFYQFVEALASSGITAGCAGGNFCPDAPLTRGQMAVFLSKALGLHWPN